MDITFVYDYNQVYLYDQSRPWPEDKDLFTAALEDANSRGGTVGIADGLVDLLMVRQDNFEAALSIETHAAAPELDESEWEHIIEFPLELPSGNLVLSASGGSGDESVELAPGSYQARWSGRKLTEAADWDYPEDEDSEEEPPDEYRLQLWPQPAATVNEIKRSPAYSL